LFCFSRQCPGQFMPADDRSRGWSNVQVIVRVRPPQIPELKYEQVLLVDGTRMTVDVPLDVEHIEERSSGAAPALVRRSASGAPRSAAGRPSRVQSQRLDCDFDRILGVEASQQDLWDSVSEGIESIFDGYNSTVFAYGMTGSGKTYSMMGPELMAACWGPSAAVAPVQRAQTAPSAPRLSAQRDAHITRAPNRGLTVRVGQMIFDRIGKIDGETRVYMSYLQVYQENIFDLLKPASMAKPLRTREDGAGGTVYVEGLTESAVGSEDELFQLLLKGSLNRAYRSTVYNEQSSRSHAVLTLRVEQVLDPSKGTVRRSRLNLIDLAGNERWDKDAKGQVMTSEHTAEMTTINRSLHALGKCIASLAKGDSFVPFRDSKLTRILQESLGGNGRTYVVCTVAGCAKFAAQTISTLRFADRAKRVKMKCSVNDVEDVSVLVRKYQQEIAYLRTLVDSKATGELEQRVRQLGEENDELRTQLSNAATRASGEAAFHRPAVVHNPMYPGPVVARASALRRAMSEPSIGCYAAASDTREKQDTREDVLNKITLAEDKLGGVKTELRQAIEQEEFVTADAIRQRRDALDQEISDLKLVLRGYGEAATPASDLRTTVGLPCETTGARHTPIPEVPQSRARLPDGGELPFTPREWPHRAERAEPRQEETRRQADNARGRQAPGRRRGVTLDVGRPRPMSAGRRQAAGAPYLSARASSQRSRNPRVQSKLRLGNSTVSGPVVPDFRKVDLIQYYYSHVKNAAASPDKFAPCSGEDPRDRRPERSPAPAQPRPATEDVPSAAVPVAPLSARLGPVERHQEWLRAKHAALSKGADAMPMQECTDKAPRREDQGCPVDPGDAAAGPVVAPVRLQPAVQAPVQLEEPKPLTVHGARGIPASDSVSTAATDVETRPRPRSARSVPKSIAPVPVVVAPIRGINADLLQPRGRESHKMSHLSPRGCIPARPPRAKPALQRGPRTVERRVIIGRDSAAIRQDVLSPTKAAAAAVLQRGRGDLDRGVGDGASWAVACSSAVVGPVDVCDASVGKEPVSPSGATPVYSTQQRDTSAVAAEVGCPQGDVSSFSSMFSRALAHVSRERPPSARRREQQEQQQELHENEACRNSASTLEPCLPTELRPVAPRPTRRIAGGASETLMMLAKMRMSSSNAEDEAEV